MEKKKEKEKQTPKKFEDALERLEDITGRLEAGEVDLEKSIELYEEGMKLATFCRARLDDAERRIEILQKKKVGLVEAAPIRIKPDTGEIEDDEEVQGSLL